MNKKFLIILFISAFVLAACGSSAVTKEEKQAQLRPDIDSIQAVQRAVDEFQADNGVLPIKNSEQDTDVYIKYQIDFSKLAPKYLTQAPLNSFEKGGLFQYVLWDVENDPTVKLIDLRIPEKLRELNIRQLSEQYPAFGQEVGEFVYKIDFKALGFDAELTVQSPYTTNLLPLIVTGEGDVYVDYTLDLQKALEASTVELSNEDARALLISDDSYFLPAYSLPYKINENNEIVIDYDAKKSMEEKRQKRIEEYEKKQQAENNQ